MPVQPLRLSKNPQILAAAVFATALGSLVLRWLALPSVFFSVIALLTFPLTARANGTRATATLLWSSALLTLVGLTRFVVLDAVPGIVQGGEQAVMLRAVSHLREILRVEDALRHSGAIDPDGDGIGSAGLIGELSGATPVRHGHLDHIPLNKRFQSMADSPIGPVAIIDGYAFAVCLKTRDGGYAARPGSDFDEEASERGFVAYAWPMDPSRSSFSIDAQGRVVMRPNGLAGRHDYFGQLHPPACSVAAIELDTDGWIPWRGKKTAGFTQRTASIAGSAHAD